MDVEACRARLRKLLAEESGTLQQLEALLAREHESLTANDFAAFECTGKAREACVGELVCLEGEWHALCRAINIPTGQKDIARLVRQCDDSGVLIAAWTERTERAMRCRTLNDRNSALVSMRLDHTQSLLDIVTDRGVGRSRVYGRQGLFQTQQQPVRVLASV